MKLSVPVRVQGHTQEGTALGGDDHLRGRLLRGASFNLKHSTFPGQVLLLSLPLPKNFRQYALPDASYTTYGLVRSVLRAWPAARIGVMFLGRRSRPRATQRTRGAATCSRPTPSPRPGNAAAQAAVDVFVNLRLKLVDPAGRTLREEQTVTENLGRGRDAGDDEPAPLQG